MAERKVFSVIEITRYIKSKLEGDFALRNVKISGEVSDCKEDKKGHIYFTIKDDAAVMSCAMWMSKRSAGLDFKLEKGQHIVVTGNIGVYERWGDYRLYADKIEKEGVGRLFVELEKLKLKLRAEGLFDESHKKPIPRYPKKIGIITSRTGAVIRGIKRFEEEGVDTIIIGRGGGSTEDLWCFNDEKLARTVYSCRIPVISAVGHQTDRTLVDEVSDLSVATPTAAAMNAVPNLALAFNELDSFKDSITNKFQLRIDRMKSSIDKFEYAIRRQSPQMKLKEVRRQIENYSQNYNRMLILKLDNYDKAVTKGKQQLDRLMRASYETFNKRFISITAEIEGKSPMKRLMGGYSYVENEAGENIRSVKSVKQGEKLNLVLADGSVKARVEEINKKNG